MGNKTMSITEINDSSKIFKDTHTIQVGGFGKTKQPPKWFVDFANEMRDFVKKQIEFNKSMLEFKDYVLDVFKRNDLK